MWKKGCLLKSDGNRLESDELFGTAMKIKHDLTPADARQVEELQDGDWADVIFYWSR